MKKEIIEQMRKRLGPGRFAQSDFEQDLNYIENYEGMFFWLSRENGTSLIKINPDYVLGTMTETPENDPKTAERFRIFWFKDFYTFIFSALYWSGESKIYFYNGVELTEINEEKAKDIWAAMYGDLYETFKKKYAKEYEVAHKKLPIHFKCSLSYVKNWLRKAEELGDTSLINGLKRLRAWGRCAINQEILVFKDYSDGGFYFEEMVNGHCRLNGGLLMTSSNGNRWSMHT